MTSPEPPPGIHGFDGMAENGHAVTGSMDVTAEPCPALRGWRLRSGTGAYFFASVAFHTYPKVSLNGEGSLTSVGFRRANVRSLRSSSRGGSGRTFSFRNALSEGIGQ